MEDFIEAAEEASNFKKFAKSEAGKKEEEKKGAGYMDTNFLMLKTWLKLNFSKKNIIWIQSQRKLRR
jgi:hypothetical protein